MHLHVKIEDGSIIVYREKWGTIAYELAMGLLCIFIAAYFYYIGATKAPTAFLIVFCGMFSICGAAIMARLPREARHILTNGGAQVMVAKVSGITLTTDLGGKSRYYPWEMVCELILAERLSLVYPDGEQVSYLYQMIVVFNSDAHEKGHWLNEFCTRITKSGEGRSYLVVDYPKNSSEIIQLALKSIIPHKLRIGICKKVEFNRKSCEDSYTEV